MSDRWIPQRPDLPTRPDLPPPPMPAARRPRRPRRWGAVVVAIVLCVAGVASAVVTASDRSPAADTGYRFLHAIGEYGEIPIRWNPCEPIHYQVNLLDAPQDAVTAVQRAVALTSEATGIAFEFDGVTDRTATQQIDDYFMSDLTDPRWFPVLVSWLPHHEFVKSIAKDERNVLAYARPVFGEGATIDQYTSGIVVADAGQTFTPAGRYSLPLVLAHELGHIVGLGHVADPDELMFASKKVPPEQIDGWGPGDLTGLRLVGSEAGCMAHIAVSDAPAT